MEPALWPTLADAVTMLEARGIQSALIGGLAVSLRGQPRMTADVDLVVLATVDDALRLVRELDSTSFAPLFSGVRHRCREATRIPLLALRAWMGSPGGLGWGAGAAYSHASPNRKREESALRT